jgi:hypothetical protein
MVSLQPGDADEAWDRIYTLEQYHTLLEEKRR